MNEAETKLKIQIVRKNRDEITFVFGAICVIGIVEIFAILKGFNGQLLRAVCCLIAMLVGITIPCPNIWEKIKKLKEMV